MEDNRKDMRVFRNDCGLRKRGWNFIPGAILCFTWGIIALQCCMSFGCTKKGISSVSTESPSLWPSLPAAPHPTSPGITEHRAGSPALWAGPHWPSSSQAVVHVCQAQSPNLSQPPFLPLGPHVHPLHLHLYSCPANRFICTIFFWSHT